MFGAIACVLVAALAAPTLQQSAPRSPCPNVFMYEPSGTEPGRWYGVVNLSTDSTLHSLWLNIVLDSKADILGNWVGDVTTSDNIDFKIENTKMKIHPGPAVAVRFFVQYNPLKTPIPRLQAIRLNGRVICNANTPQPTDEGPDASSTRPSRPETPSREQSHETVRPVATRPVESRPPIRPEDTPVTRPVHGTPSNSGPVYVPTANPPIDKINVNPFVIGDGQPPSANRPRNEYGHTTVSYSTTTTTESADIDDFDTIGKPDRNDYFTGGLQTIIVPSNTDSGYGNNYGSNNNNQRPQKRQCGKVVMNKPNPLVVNGKPTLEGQWPWQIALYQAQTVDSKYICGGTLLTHLHIITAAHCVTRQKSNRVVNKNTLTVYLGKHNLRTSVRGVQIRYVDQITVHPQYNASSYSHDVAILTLLEPVQYSEYVRPICLWPEDQVELNNVVGKKGSVVGWGFDETGVATEELALVEMPVVDQETCIRSLSEFFAKFTSQYTYCAGYRDGTSVCNGDSGGGMVFEMNDSWYLRGLVSLSVARQNEYRCDPSHYVVFTDLAKFLPWIRQNINNY